MKKALAWFVGLVIAALVWWAAGVAARYVHQTDRPYQVDE
jgi:hypothetical protein